MWFMKVVITSVGGSFDILLSRHSFSADISSVCFMFEYKDLTPLLLKLRSVVSFLQVLFCLLGLLYRVYRT